MEDQAEILQREILGCRGRIDSKARKGEYASALPLFDGCLDLRSPHEVGLIGSGRPFVRDRNIIVWASHFMLRAVTAIRDYVSWLRFINLARQATYH